MKELLRALAVVAEGGEGLEIVAAALDLEGPVDMAAHVELFDFHLYPYASVYLGIEGMLGGEARDRVAGFWTALRFEPPAEPDHLASLLGLLAALEERAATEAEPARRALLEQARHALLWEHLLSWLPLWIERALETTEGPLRRWAELLSDCMVGLAMAVGPPSSLPAALACAPAGLSAEELRDGELAAALLAPVRTGAIVVREDLRRLAGDLGIGLRAGERRFAMRSLLEQDRAGTLAWLAGHIDRQAARTDRWPAAWAPVVGFWAERARSSASSLEALAAPAAGVMPGG
ncbi:MAG: hypothetical protein NVSMB29_15490 [Candidatus Dormibacteria bacterium]